MSNFIAHSSCLNRVEILERMGQYQISVSPEQPLEELTQEVAETLELPQPNL